ncbi:FAD-dependent oxidoreductase [Actinoplanes derwentensis]|uniref:2-polyprenyl-6-methoxyphenol hydroxylase n=1 Tax=Actinoplanes derwentensis TaxID=113562 RepID=A0A1H1W9B2_9ACTN|nr:NAD(P)/FAD-dependent oxidoreductase [Actinoplanes derwentensis]GID84093.1 2-octaprenyl-3-methyl-6-methoxy-1,4-benzoquinol hydroxylase [Actinoplanes derwentensis]SDS93552.1 2-polyprenyl-6-methoxyphenol hydroxylase [Actinoplanes derwentensis]
MTDTDVLICGAGVGGLATARAFAAAGLRVIVADRRTTPPPVAKGELLQPEAVRLLDQWGALPEAVPVDRLAIRDPHGRMLLPLDYSTLGGDHRQILCADHPAILAALAHEPGPGIDLRLGVAIQGLLRDAGGRTRGVQAGGTEITAGLVVAADGVSSTLRTDAEIEVQRTPYPHRLVAFELPATTVAPEVTAYLSGRGLRLVYPLPGGRARLYVQVQPDELRDGAFRDPDAWINTLLDEVPALTAIGPALRAHLDRRQNLAVQRLRTPRLTAPGLALVGESAHVVHPMAAQGINSSLADAAVLADLSAGALHAGDTAAVDQALLAYQRQRLPRLDHTATVSHNAARMLTTTGGAARLLGRRMMRHTATNPRLLRLTTGNMSGVELQPLRTVDRLYQFGLLTDRHAGTAPAHPATKGADR